MHRGGAADAGAMGAIIAVIEAHPDALELRGFMAYDAHVARAPWPRRPTEAARRAAARFGELLGHAQRQFPGPCASLRFRNGAGSPTFGLLTDASPCDDVALGSILVKPADFDLPWLAEVEPAVWIAAPVLKDSPGFELPYFERTSRVLSGSRRTLFVHGGRWMARPAWPPGLAECRLYGRSSNQQCLTVPAAAEIGVDDYVFFRPTQSEVVLAQFGFVTVVHPDERIEHWTSLAPVEAGFDG
jgi:D-serine deaminase-like pyridoxal phosphate-dependent protein